MFRLLTATVLAIILNGCSNNHQQLSRIQAVKTIFPSLGEKSTVNMGEQMFVEGTGFIANCIVPLISHTESFSSAVTGKSVVTMKANESLCVENFEGQYIPRYNNIKGIAGDYRYPFRIVDQKNAISFCTLDSDCFRLPLGSYKKQKDFIFNESILKQAIEFMGKSGKVLEFTYTEFQNNSARHAFTRNFKLDMNETNILAFKGAKVEIVDVSSSTISYRVLKGFQ